MTSTNTAGSGSFNTSVLNDGTGVDGVIGQTYIDAVTGFSFTLLPRSGGQPYPTGNSSTLSFKVSREILQMQTLPVSAIAGVSLIVANTVGTEVGDTVLIETYLKDGERAFYRHSVLYGCDSQKKTAFSTGVFTSF